MDRDDPLNPNGRYKDLLRKNAAGTDFKVIREQKTVQVACEMFLKGAGIPGAYREMWKRADRSNRAHVTFDDMYEVTGCPFVFQVHDEKKKHSGISGRAGVYLGGIPPKLISAYETWTEYAEDAYPDKVAVLVFRLPFLAKQIAVLREGTTACNAKPISKLVYLTEDRDYTLQSAFSFGQESADLW